MLQVRNQLLLLPLWLWDQRPSIPQVEVASWWPLAIVAGAETHDIMYIYIWQRPDMSMKLVGCLNHSNLTHATSVELNPHTLLLPPPPLWLWDPAYHVEVASLWPLAAVEGAETHYIIYMYEVDLILVLSGWGASTITYNMIQVRNQDNLLLPFWLWDKAHIRLELHSYVAGAETLYMYEVDMSMKWMVVSQS